MSFLVPSPPRAVLLCPRRASEHITKDHNSVLDGGFISSDIHTWLRSFNLPTFRESMARCLSLDISSVWVYIQLAEAAQFPNINGFGFGWLEQFMLRHIAPVASYATITISFDLHTVIFGGIGKLGIEYANTQLWCYNYYGTYSCVHYYWCVYAGIT